MNRRPFRSKGHKEQPRYRINERIRADQVRLIDEHGRQVGIVPLKEALRQAESKGLDLVEIAPQANPVVCRIIDYGKFLYEQKKKAQEARKKQTVITVKEIKFRPGTDAHDYNFKKNNAERILKGGDKVKAVVHFRGREIVHKELGQQLLQRLIDELADVSVVENQPRLEGYNLIAVLGPKK
ncbi:MAG: translation initiation factor IF-3 [Acidobacteriota bacterium]|nr:translation initiation factor IF-3 [Acidobacteriota bacterium]